MLRRTKRFLVALLAAAALGWGAVPDARAEDPIRIGFGMAQTGALAGAGKAALIAIRIWAEDTNAAGGAARAGP